MRAEALWLLVMCETRARILRDPAAGSARHGRTELVLRAESRALRRVLDDPARPQVTGGCLRAEMSLQQDETIFLAQVVAVLEAHRLAGDFAGLVVIAPPRTLALVLGRMPLRLRGQVLVQIPRSLVHLSAGEVRRIVAAETGSAG